jgi:hypothetical protein
LNGELIIDRWHEATNTLYNVERTLSAADHTLRVEYYENMGTSSILFWWERQGAFTDWRGAYFPTIDLTGTPTLVRNDAAINFNWGSGSPFPGLPGDGFSARWTQTMNLDEGLYRFHVTVDDGARLWVDDVLVVDTWGDGGRREETGEYRLSSGFHTLRVEYYERTGEALIIVWWEKVNM